MNADPGKDSESWALSTARNAAVKRVGSRAAVIVVVALLAIGAALTVWRFF